MSLFVFGALFAFISFVSELQHVGINNYGALQALLFVTLNLPQLLYQVFPSAMLLGGLLSLGALASTSELIVMRAAGISIMRITGSVLKAGVLLIAIVVLLGEFLAPVAISMAKTMRAEALEGRVLTGDRTGLWSKYGDNFVYIGTVLPDVKLRDVVIYELDEQQTLKKTTFAEQAHYEDGLWHLKNVSSSEINKQGIKTAFNEYETWPAMVSTDLFNVLNLEPEDMSASELWQYSLYLDENELDSDSFWLAFWVKVFTPLTSVGMLMISVPLVLTSSSRSGGAGQRIMVGVMIGVAFYVLNRVVNQMGIIHGIRETMRVFRDNLTKVSANVYDPNLVEADTMFRNDEKKLFFPSAESRFSKGVKYLEHYVEALHADPPTSRPLNKRIIELIKVFEAWTDLLGDGHANLYREKERDGSPVRSWKTDNHFYVAQGYAHVMFYVMQAVQREYGEDLKGSVEFLFDEVLDALGKAHALKPLVILDGSPAGLFANHRWILDSYISEARDKMFSIQEELEK